MKTYDVTIKLQFVAMRPVNPMEQIHAAAERLVATMATSSENAAWLDSVHVVDRDSIPQQVRLCPRCGDRT